MASWKKRIAGARWVHLILGTLAAYYLRLVWFTTRWILEPADGYERIKPDLPLIIAMWHGQHFMVPFAKRPEHRVKVLISRHRDGEINAVAAARLGVGAIRGSGDHGSEFNRKGGVTAFKEMVVALGEGWLVALTADVPKKSRIAGLGIVMLARDSGRPIYAIAMATSRRIALKNWDRSAINLPFSRGSMVMGEPIHVPRDAEGVTLETYRQKVEEALNAVTARAYELVDEIKVSH